MQETMNRCDRVIQKARETLRSTGWAECFMNMNDKDAVEKKLRIPWKDFLVRGYEEYARCIQLQTNVDIETIYYCILLGMHAFPQLETKHVMKKHYDIMSGFKSPFEMKQIANGALVGAACMNVANQVFSDPSAVHHKLKKNQFISLLRCLPEDVLHQKSAQTWRSRRGVYVHECVIDKQKLERGDMPLNVPDGRICQCLIRALSNIAPISDQPSIIKTL